MDAREGDGSQKEPIRIIQLGLRRTHRGVVQEDEPVPLGRFALRGRVQHVEERPGLGTKQKGREGGNAQEGQCEGGFGRTIQYGRTFTSDQRRIFPLSLARAP
jgi:hypothetical protein